MRLTLFRRTPVPLETICRVRIIFAEVSTLVVQFTCRISVRVVQYYTVVRINCFSLLRMKESKPEVRCLPEALSLLQLLVSPPCKQFPDWPQTTSRFLTVSYPWRRPTIRERSPSLDAKFLSVACCLKRRTFSNRITW